jgi:hypothetical protein
MKLGTMLLRDGRVTQAQIDAAVAHQARHGGRFGTVLFELGLIDADTLTVYLGLELGIPIASRGVLDRAKRAAVNLLSPELAERHLCVPLVVQDRELIAAMKDPHDLIALDELATTTQHRIIPRVAPEIRLYYYVERYFGVPRPARYRAMGDRVIETRRVTADTLEAPAPPLPGLPPPVASPVRPPPTPAPALRTVVDEQVVDAEALAVEMEADEAETAEVAPAPAPRATTPTPPAMPPPAPPAELAAPPPTAAAPSELPPILELDSAIDRMREASTRADIAAALLGFARTIFDVCALLVVRDDLAFGWKGFGPDLDTDRIEAMLVPLEAKSIFRQAVEANDLHAGPAEPSAIHSYLFKVLRTSPPPQAVVAPVSIRERVVNLLYGHKLRDAELPETDLDALKLVARAAATAYARLITAQKKGG